MSMSMSMDMNKDVKDDWGEFAEQAADGLTSTPITTTITEPIESVNDNKVQDENHIDIDLDIVMSMSMDMNKDVKEDWGEFAEQAADGSTSTPRTITMTEPIEVPIDDLHKNDQLTPIDDQNDDEDEDDWGDFDESSNVSAVPHEETKKEENIDLPTINHLVNVSTVLDHQLNPKFYENFDQIRKQFNNKVK